MKYQPLTCVWEVTMGCNMRCGHCGSSCTEPLSDELNTEEAFYLIDQLKQIGLKWITLSGGEPLTRKDLPLLVKRLSQHSIIVNMITNGWLMNENIAGILKENGISTIAISIDGTEKIHDSIRRKGSFARAVNAFRILRSFGITVGAVTTVSKKNIDILPELRDQLIEMGVNSWQLQIGLPMGNFVKQPDWLIEPEQVNSIIDFCYETSMQGKIKVFPADCIGYYTEKEIIVRQRTYETNYAHLWDGCNAGIRGFGILQNGDILGCTSIRSAEFIEGNIRERKLIDIWEDPTKFTWRRNLKKNKLEGECSNCAYGSKCLGGCPNTRLTIKGSIYSENNYCSYNIALKKLKKVLASKSNHEELFEIALRNAKENNFQETSLIINRYLELQSGNPDALKLQGFAEFMCGNYDLSERANRKILEIFPEDTYAMKGLGLALHKQGKSQEGIEFVERAARITNYSDKDILHDLSVIRNEFSQA